MRSFEEWKVDVEKKLLALVYNANLILSRLDSCNLSNLHEVMLCLHRVNLKELLPTEDEVEFWFKEAQKRG